MFKGKWPLIPSAILLQNERQYKFCSDIVFIGLLKWIPYEIELQCLPLAAHTTQFTEPGWRYLPHGHGVGMLNKGGSYVTIVSPNLQNLTIVLEAMVCKSIVMDGIELNWTQVPISSHLKLSISA